MQVKELIKLLRRFKNAELLIDDLPVSFELYQDQTEKFYVNLKFLKNDRKSLDKEEKL